MKNRTRRWVAGFVVGLALLVLLAPAIPPPKARAQRVQGVNNLVRPFPNKDFVITNLVITNGAYPMMTKWKAGLKALGSYLVICHLGSCRWTLTSCSRNCGSIRMRCSKLRNSFAYHCVIQIANQPA